MKKTFVSFLVLLFVNDCFAQSRTDTRSIHDFFCGIPVTGGYKMWVRHMNADPDINVDSVGQRGVYASFKKERKNYFPFPEETRTRLLIYKGVPADSLNRAATDTLESISIEGIFTDSRFGKMAAENCYAKLKRMLKKYYRVNSNATEGYETGRRFSRGISAGFPDLLLFKGYFYEQRFYFVVLVFERNV